MASVYKQRPVRPSLRSHPQTHVVDCCPPHPRADPLIRMGVWKGPMVQADRWAGVSDCPSLCHPEVTNLWHKPPDSRTLLELRVYDPSVHQR